jgi:predicted DNA-binding transcriptional regulator YafY
MNLSNPMNRKIKMLGMIPREPAYITASIIHERFMDRGVDIDIRTVTRDLKSLVPDFPINYHQDKTTKAYHWYFIKDAIPFDIPALTPISALSFNLVETFLEDTLPDFIIKQLSPSFRGAENYLKKMRSSSWTRWSEKIRFIPKSNQLLPAKVNPEIFETATEGLWREQQLKISYKSRDAEEALESIVHPLGLAFRFGTVYLLCTFWKFDDVRQLALHRFRSAEILPEPRSIPTGFDLDDYIAKRHFSYPISSEPIRVKLLFDEGAAFHLYESKLSEDQVLEQKEDGQVIVNATVKETSELHWWLRGFADGVEVLEPKELRDEFAERAKSMSKMYNQET